MKKFLVTAQVYDVHGFFPDLFGERQERVIEAESLAHARGIVHRRKQEMLSHVVVKSIEEIV